MSTAFKSVSQVCFVYKDHVLFATAIHCNSLWIRYINNFSPSALRFGEIIWSGQKILGNEMNGTVEQKTAGKGKERNCGA